MKRIFASFAALLAASASVAATLAPVQLLNPSGSTAGQAIVSNGPGSAPAWATVTAGGLTPIGANTVYGNFTGSSASPIANAVPSCSTSNSALKYTSDTGLSCGTTFALTTGNLSQFASTTSAQLAGVISDETGSGALVFGTSPTLTTPVIASIVNTGTLTLPTSTDTLVGRATTDTLTNKTLTTPTINGASLSGTFSGTPTFSGAVTFSSTLTPSQTSGIVGTTTNNNANAGSFGEYQAAAPGAISLTTGTAANIASVSLAAGDWDVDCTAIFIPAGGTTVSSLNAAVTTTSATLPGATSAQTTFNLTFTTGAAQGFPVPTVRVSLASTTTTYCVGAAAFGVSTMQGQGIIRARRVR